MPWVGQQCVIVAFSGHTNIRFVSCAKILEYHCQMHGSDLLQTKLNLDVLLSRAKTL